MMQVIRAERRHLVTIRCGAAVQQGDAFSLSVHVPFDSQGGHQDPVSIIHLLRPDPEFAVTCVDPSLSDTTDTPTRQWDGGG